MNLFFRKTGVGFPVIIIHGLYGSSDNWMQIASKLSSDFTVYTIDLRNHGQSPHSLEHSYSDMVNDLSQFMSLNSINSAHIVGHSMGGKVAIAFANDFPELVKSVTVVDIAPKNYKAHFESPMQYKFHKNILDTLNGIDLCCITKRSEVEQNLLDSFHDIRLVKFITKNLKRNKDKTFTWKLNIKTLKEHLDHIVSGVDWSDFEDRAPITSFPILFIRGGRSQYITEEDTKKIIKLYPDANIETIEDGGHWLHAESTIEFISILQSFIKKR